MLCILHMHMHMHMHIPHTHAHTTCTCTCTYHIRMHIICIYIQMWKSQMMVICDAACHGTMHNYDWVWCVLQHQLWGWVLTVTRFPLSCIKPNTVERYAPLWFRSIRFSYTRCMRWDRRQNSMWKCKFWIWTIRLKSGSFVNYLCRSVMLPYKSPSIGPSICHGIVMQCSLV